jgi:hypothetical protein
MRSEWLRPPGFRVAADLHRSTEPEQLRGGPIKRDLIDCHTVGPVGRVVPDPEDLRRGWLYLTTRVGSYHISRASSKTSHPAGPMGGRAGVAFLFKKDSRGRR